MKKSYKKKLNKVYKKLQSERKNIKRRSIILASLFLGVNIFAWFVYITQVGVELDSNVVAWDVNFFDGPTQVKNIKISEILHPGMDTYEKVIEVNNNSGTKAEFEYVINSFTVLGIDSMVEEGTNEEQINSLNNDYPFIIAFEASKMTLDEIDTLTFRLTIDWHYENPGEFHRLTKHFTYDPSVVYYQHTEDDFLPVEINETLFNQHKLDLYVEKDDADSFFGEACAAYYKQTNKPCVNLNLTLKVSQSQA